MSTTKLSELLDQVKESFGDLPVMIHDGESFLRLGRVSVLEIVELKSKCLVLRIGDPTEMETLLTELGGHILREGDEEWMKDHQEE